MIEKTFEWYRIVSPTPSSESVAARVKAATDLTAALPKQDPKTILALVQGITWQFSGSPDEANTIEWLLRTLKQHDPAVSENLLENELELRCIAAITLGELLHQSKCDPNEFATVAAAAFISAMNMRPLPEQKYLCAMIQCLSGLALNVIETAADSLRERVNLTTLTDEKLNVPDLPTAQGLISQLQNQIRMLEENAILDREEISLFWFIATGYSKTQNMAFSDLPASIATVHAALELYQALSIPSSSNSFEVLTEIVQRKRTAKSLKTIPLREHIAKWSRDEWDAIVAPASLEPDLASKYPVVFPIIWIANRMRESQATPDWTEFSRITHLEGDAELSASQLGCQLLKEKTVVYLMKE